MTAQLRELESSLNQIIVGKPEQVRLALVCLLARGHLLIEDLPGAGKTTLAKAFAALMGLDNNRIQFTADLLPADITGAMIYQVNTHEFTLQKGPIFTNILLADEINRASPKCQSALLEAMEERQISIEGQTLTLAAPFFVIATQNPSDQYGTYPLPESQLDRFLFRISLGYLDASAELSVLMGQDRATQLQQTQPLMSQSALLALQAQVETVFVSEAIANYVRALLQATRHHERFLHGLSTRAGLALMRAAQAYAFVCEKKSVYPEHVQAVFPAVAYHRLIAKNNTNSAHHEQVMKILAEVELGL
ncbi:AAA family ATPase [Ostreibacterium oceani]|uniref:AAA domain-containing protein n=1 Tax=Ostreibacterium oceani TaxID=2654998 RepID=A0A6N7ERG9_9GAMM|nr:MoxR family ATPase [Ostreibacterium oceani]MPV85131.1 AAA domain-containing protein [Ostreibacterium oceani]